MSCFIYRIIRYKRSVMTVWRHFKVIIYFLENGRVFLLEMNSHLCQTSEAFPLTKSRLVRLIPGSATAWHIYGCHFFRWAPVPHCMASVTCLGIKEDWVPEKQQRRHVRYGLLRHCVCVCYLLRTKTSRSGSLVVLPLCLKHNHETCAQCILYWCRVLIK